MPEPAAEPESLLASLEREAHARRQQQNSQQEAERAAKAERDRIELEPRGALLDEFAAWLKAHEVPTVDVVRVERAYDDLNFVMYDEWRPEVLGTVWIIREAHQGYAAITVDTHLLVHVDLQRGFEVREYGAYDLRQYSGTAAPFVNMQQMIVGFMTDHA